MEPLLPPPGRGAAWVNDHKLVHAIPYVLHDLPTTTFRYYVAQNRHLSATQKGIFAGHANLARLLEVAPLPLRRHELAAALNVLERELVGGEVYALGRRLDRALRYLQTNEWVRAVRRGRDVGWV